MDDAIEILKDSFIFFCENNNINVNKVDYITYIIVTFMWIQKLLILKVSNNNSKIFKENKSTNLDFGSTDKIQFISLFKKDDENLSYKMNAFNQEEEVVVENSDENANYIKRLEHENKQYVETVNRLKLQIESIDDLNNQLHVEVESVKRENDK